MTTAKSRQMETTNSMTTLQSSLQSAAKSVQYQVVLQLASRILTFILNGCIIRFVSKEALGIANIRLLLLYTSIQFLSREGFRRACTEQFGRTKREWKPVINLLWLNFPVCVGTAITLSFLWFYGFQRPPSTVGNAYLGQYYAYGVIAYATAACIESIAEPMFVTAQAYHFVRVRIVIQGIAITVQTLTNAVGCLYLAQRRAWWTNSTTVSDAATKPNSTSTDDVAENSRYVILVFAAAQLLYSATILVSYIGYFIFYFNRQKKIVIGQSKKNDDQNSEADHLPMSNITDFLPSFETSSMEAKNDAAVSSKVSQKHAQLAYAFLRQGMLKQLLTEGERYIMTITTVVDFRQQGIYDIVNNLGSLVVRTAFAPLEENAYLFFSRAFPRPSLAATTKATITEEFGPDDAAAAGDERAEMQRLLKETSNLICEPPMNADVCSQVLQHAIPSPNNDSKNNEAEQHKSATRSIPPAALDDVAEDEKRHALATLYHLLRFVSLLSLIAFAFGFNYCDILLRVYGGNDLAVQATRMMQTYCLYIVFLAINGILEAFAFAVMTETQVHQSSQMFIKISLAYVLTAFIITRTLLQRDATGFILANCVSMAVRIVYSYKVAHAYLKRYTEKFQNLEISENETSAASGAIIIRAVIPHSMVLKALAISIMFCYSSKLYVYQLHAPLFSMQTFGHLVIGDLFGLMTLWAVWKFERHTILFIRDILRGKSSNSALEPIGENSQNDKKRN